MLMKVSYGSLFIYCGSYLTKPVSLSAWAWAAAPRPVSFRPVNPNETKGAKYERQKDVYKRQELHIEKLKDRNLFDLSGGQKQTIAFASVYALNPDIFVLDEPSSNLDPEAIQELRRLLLLIKAQGKTIVVSEHRLYFLNGIADRICLLYTSGTVCRPKFWRKVMIV